MSQQNSPPVDCDGSHSCGGLDCQIPLGGLSVALTNFFLVLCCRVLFGTNRPPLYKMWDCLTTPASISLVLHNQVAGKEVVCYREPASFEPLACLESLQAQAHDAMLSFMINVEVLWGPTSSARPGICFAMGQAHQGPKTLVYIRFQRLPFLLGLLPPLSMGHTLGRSTFFCAEDRGAALSGIGCPPLYPTRDYDSCCDSRQREQGACRAQVQPQPESQVGCQFAAG